MATFGKTSDGSNVQTFSGDRIYLSTATPSSSGQVTSGWGRVRVTSASTSEIRVVIFSDSGGEPDEFLAMSDEVAVNWTTSTLTEFPFSGANQIDVFSGTPYWIGFWADDPGTPSYEYKRDNSSNVNRFASDAYPGSGSPTTPFSSGGSSNGPLNCYIEYDEGGTLHTPTLSETVTLADSVLKLPSRILSNAASLADTIARTASRTLSDGVTWLETVTRSAARSLSDAVSGSDTFASVKTQFATLSDAVTWLDESVRSLARTLADPVTWTDALSRATSRAVSEAATLADATSRLTSRAIAETATLADTFARGNPSVLFATGTYTGNGTDNRAITGLGFTPKVILIKKRDAGGGEEPSVWKTDTMGSNQSVRTHGSSPSVPTTAIKTVDADGITLGTHAAVNRNTSTYVWYAWGGGLVKTGSYTGDGSTRDITGVGFSPEWVAAFRTDSAQATYHRFASRGDADSWPLVTSTPGSGRITAMVSDGFSLGTSAEVNGSGGSYHYVAINGKPGVAHQGTFTGNGADNRSITGVGFQPDAMIWTRDAAGNSARNRSSAIAGDNAQFFSEFAETSNEVQAFESDGFQVGSSTGSNPSGETVHYLALKVNLTEGTLLTQVLSDAATLADSLVRSLVRAVSETVTHADAIVRTATRNLADAVTGSDTFGYVKLVSTTLSDAVSWADDLMRSVTRQLSEAVTGSDSVQTLRSFARELSEAPSLSAMASIAYGRVLSEAVTLVEFLRKVLNGIATFYRNTYDRISAAFSGTYTPSTPTYGETHEPESSSYGETYTPGATEHEEAHLPGSPDYRETYRDE